MAISTSGLFLVAAVLSGNGHIDPLISTQSSNHYKWSPGLSSSTVLTFSFATSSSTWGDRYRSARPSGTTFFSEEQKNNIRTALHEWEKVADITFTEVPDNASQSGDIRFSYDDEVGIYNGAWASTYPLWPDRSTMDTTDQELPNEASGDIFIGAKFRDNELAPGTQGFTSVLHEIGHAIGLAHPFEGKHQLPENEDNVNNTIMSYTTIPYYYPTKPAPYDIEAAQYLYGKSKISSVETPVPPTGTGSGDSQDEWKNFVCNLYPNDPACKSDESSNNNGLTNGGGDDLIESSLVGNVLDGGSGTDTVTYERASRKIYANLLTQKVTGGGNTDVLRSIESITGSSFNDKIKGNVGSNILKGLSGKDIITGGAGDDIIVGGDGNDTLSGGKGADTFVFDNTRSVDIVHSFRSAQGDKIQLNNGYFVNQTFVSVNKLAQAANGEGVIFEKSTGKLYYDQDGAGLGSPATAFAKLVNTHKLIQSDIIFNK